MPKQRLVFIAYARSLRDVHPWNISLLELVGMRAEMKDAFLRGDLKTLYYRDGLSAQHKHDRYNW